MFIINCIIDQVHSVSVGIIDINYHETLEHVSGLAAHH